MTKVQVTVKLSRPLDDQDLNSISRIHSIYGFFATRVLPSGEALFVEYDASRLSKNEVLGALQEHGIPVA